MKINDNIFDVFPELESERLQFRAYKNEDAKRLLSIRSNALVSKYMDTTLPVTVEDSKQRIAKIQSSFNDKTGITWAIIEKSSNMLIGDFGIWRFDKNNSRGEIGYVLSPEFWGKGYMTEAFTTLVNFAFSKLNLHSLEANINPENENSKILLSKFGFKQEAYFRENYFYNGRFLDSEIYCLLKSDIE
ncbi:GNAT family N-acetyltransferase [Flavobacteriales bacterium 34_180_T64]|nr:GNAT family N-acetyltransferase [Flavobacteriales bacterium 34_180_T64]